MQKTGQIKLYFGLSLAFSFLHRRQDLFFLGQLVTVLEVKQRLVLEIL